MAKVLALIFLQLTTVLGEKSYDGYHLISIPIRSKEELNFVSELHKAETEIDVWNEPHSIGHNATVSVPPSAVEAFMATLHSAGLTPSTITTNLQRWIDNVKSSMEPQTGGGRSSSLFRLDFFHRHSAINIFLDTVSRKCQSGVYSASISCELLTIGTSYEGREMKVLRIHPKGEKNVPAIWIDAGIHAREWAAPATAVFIIYKLLDTASDLESQILLSSFEWYILPSANPDGYEYSHTTDRMWRKTRSENNDPDCMGTDPNRNWDFHWNEVGASNFECSQIFAGDHPFSEIETSAMSDFLLENKDKFLVYLTIHSFGQYWLTPWGFTEELPEDYDDLVDVANAAANAIYEEGGNIFTVGTSTNVLYAAAGGSDDWAKGVAGIKYAFTVELRDTGNYGFMLPRSQVVPCGREMWAGVKAMAEKVLQHIEDGRAA